MSVPSQAYLSQRLYDLPYIQATQQPENDREDKKQTSSDAMDPSPRAEAATPAMRNGQCSNYMTEYYFVYITSCDQSCTKKSHSFSTVILLRLQSNVRRGNFASLPSGYNATFSE